MTREQFFAALLLLRKPGSTPPRLQGEYIFLSLPRHIVYIKDSGIEVTHYTTYGEYMRSWKGALTDENLNRIVEEMV